MTTMKIYVILGAAVLGAGLAAAAETEHTEEDGGVATRAFLAPAAIMFSDHTWPSLRGHHGRSLIHVVGQKAHGHTCSASSQCASKRCAYGTDTQLMCCKSENSSSGWGNPFGWGWCTDSDEGQPCAGEHGSSPHDMCKAGLYCRAGRGGLADREGFTCQKPDIKLGRVSNSARKCIPTEMDVRAGKKHGSLVECKDLMYKLSDNFGGGYSTFCGDCPAWMYQQFEALMQVEKSRATKSRAISFHR